MQLKGNVHVYGDNIDTDRIIPGKYTKTLNIQDFADHVLEDLDPEFRNRMKKGDIIVGGNNFGCGSSREQAPLALKTAGVSCVIAKSFARIFFRNAINIGLPLIEVKEIEANNGDVMEVDITTGEVINKTTPSIMSGTKMPEVMVSILNEGGLVPYLNKYGTYDVKK